MGTSRSMRTERRGAAILLLAMAGLFLPGTALAQQSTTLVGAGGGTYPPGTLYNGVEVTSMRFGMGIDLPAALAPVVGNFEFTLLGTIGGVPRTIVIEGIATAGFGDAATGATVTGVTAVDMGDGSLPVIGLPFVLTATTSGPGQGTLAMVIDNASLPPATVTTGSLGVDECVPPLPTLVTDNLCGVGAGLIGTSWISLPSYSPLKTANDLCTALGPNATVVTQKFADSTGPGTIVAGTWTFDCGSHACTPGAVTPPFEAGCSAADCFCINPGEGYEVVVSAPTTFDVVGCESQVPIVLPPGGSTYLISVPINTNLVTLNDLALHIGLASTGVVRGTVVGLNGCTGATTVCSAGTVGCISATLVPGRAYRVRYTHINGTTFINPTTSTAQCPPPC